MNQSEFMAMLDVRLSDGKVYPTLDDYTVALDKCRRLRAMVTTELEVFARQHGLMGAQSQAEMNLRAALGMGNLGAAGNGVVGLFKNMGGQR